MSEHKALTSVEIKDAEAGTVQAVFATLGVIDSDGDVTVKGAFENEAPVRISAYGHTSWGGALPVGKGFIKEVGDEAILDSQLFLNTAAGREHFETIKEMGPLMEWSYGYDVVEADTGEFEGQKVRYLKKLKVHEVSPVLLGAGVGTRTLAVKSDLPFSEQADSVLGDVRALIDRAKTFGSQSTDERKEGRVLSAANRERLAALAESLGEAGVSLSDFLAATDPDKDEKAAQVLIESLYLGHLRLESGL